MLGLSCDKRRRLWWEQVWWRCNVPAVNNEKSYRWGNRCSRKWISVAGMYCVLGIPRWTYASGFRVDLQIASLNHSTTNGMHMGIFRIRVYVNEHCFSAQHRCCRCLFRTFPVVAPASTSAAVSLFTRCGCWQRLTVSKRQCDVISNHMCLAWGWRSN